MNKVASPCCGSCEYYKNKLRFPCAKYHDYVRISELSCHGEHYSPRNPIPIIDLLGIEELEELINKWRVFVGLTAVAGMGWKDKAEKVEAEVRGKKMTSRVLRQINEEREMQDKKWGEQNHSPIEWSVILGKEFGEVCKGAVKVFNYSNEDYWDYREELIHTAAVAIAAIESLDRAVRDPDDE